MISTFPVEILPAVGCIVIILMALVAAVFQARLFVRSPENKFNGWGSVLSLVTAVFAATSFVQYGGPPDSVAIVSERIQFCTFPLIAHCLHGFSQSYFRKNFTRRNRILWGVDVFMITMAWIPNVAITDTVIHKNISSLVSSYPEPKLGPLGGPFIILCYILSLASAKIWYSHLKTNKWITIPFFIGFSIWIITTLHDILVTFGMPAYMYLMSYGVLGFNISVIWATMEDYMGLKRKLEEHKSDLERQVKLRTVDLWRKNRELEDEIRERKQAEDALKESNARFRDVTDLSPVAIAEFNNNLKITFVNKAALRMFGYTQEDFIKGIYLPDLIPPETAAAAEKGIDNILFGKLIGYHEYTLKKKNGDSIVVLINTIPVRADGKVLGGRISGLDITDKKQMEKQLRQSQKMEAIGTLAGGVAHDFNNILSAVIGYTELALMKTDANESNRQELDKLLVATDKAKALVKQILTFSRQTDIMIKPLNLNRVIHSAVDLLGRTIPRMINVHLNLAEDLHSIRGDSHQLEQVIVNLGINASDAMTDGGDLFIQTRNVSIGNHECSACGERFHGDYVCLTIQDTGCGMNKETLEHIFEPFFTTKEIGRGTGLGLAIVFGVVTAHDGHIVCHSKEGAGTTFEVYLRSLGVKRSFEIARSEIREEEKGRGETILLVDDEEALREIGGATLKMNGHEVITADSGEAALAVYSEHREKIDLVLLDINMPGMGGYQCLQRLRAMDAQAKVLIASGYFDDDKLQKALKDGAAGYITKPYMADDLMKAVRNALDR